MDAKTALNILATIEKLAKSGRSVVLTIHQPRSDIFHIFDKLLLMARGKIAYFGKATEGTRFFSKLGYTCPNEYNPADFIIDLVAEAPAFEHETIKKKQETIIDNILTQYQQVRHEVEVAPPFKGDIHILSKVKSYQSAWIVQLVVIFWRYMVNIVRDGTLTFARLFQSVFMALVIGLIYLRTQYYQSNVQDRIGVLFFMMDFAAMSSLFSALSTFPADLAVFLRERGSKTYHVSSYFLGKTLAEIPHQILFPTLFGAIVYWIVGLNPSVDRFFIFLLTLFVIAVSGQSFGQLISIISPNPDVAFTLGPVISTLLMLFGGFYMNVANIPVYFVWIYWISFFHYGFEALVLNEFTGVTFICRESEFKQGPGGIKICPIESGNQVVSNLNMTGVLSNVWINLGFMVAIIVVCRTLSFLGMRFLKNSRVR